MKYVIAFCVLFAVACGDSATSIKVTDIDPKDVIEEMSDAGKEAGSSKLEGCYTRITGRDTLTMQLNIKDTVATGKLHYDNFEKDGSTGSFHGELRGDILIINYAFEAEGMHSVREIVYKVDGTNLKEGLGEIEVKGDAVKFKNKDDLDFNTLDPLVKTNCK